MGATPDDSGTGAGSADQRPETGQRLSGDTAGSGRSTTAGREPARMAGQGGKPTCWHNGAGGRTLQRMRTCRASDRRKLTAVLATLVLVRRPLRRRPQPPGVGGVGLRGAHPWRAEINKLDQQHPPADDRADHPGAGEGEPGAALRRRGADASETARRRIDHAGIRETEPRRRDLDAASRRPWARSRDALRPRPGHHRRARTPARPPPSTTGCARPRWRPSTRSTTRARWTPGGSTPTELKQAFDEVPECR